MFNEQVIEVKLRGPDSRGRTCNRKTGYSYNKAKISKANS